MIFNKIASKD